VQLRVPAALDLGALAALPSAQDAASPAPGLYVLRTRDAGTLLVELTSFLRAAGVVPTELRVGAGSLEDVYLRLTSDGER
jgi:ABC-2 type transport system ATP-binding protein